MIQVRIGSRAVDVPLKERVLGAVGDVNIRTVMFSVPRMCDGVDMAGFGIEVHYANAAGVEDYTPIVDSEVNGENIEFGWHVPSLACACSGKVSATVKLRDALHEFNSGIGLFEVVPSKENDPHGDQLADDAGNVIVIKVKEDE